MDIIIAYDRNYVHKEKLGVRNNFNYSKIQIQPQQQT